MKTKQPYLRIKVQLVGSDYGRFEMTLDGAACDTVNERSLLHPVVAFTELTYQVEEALRIHTQWSDEERQQIEEIEAEALLAGAAFTMNDLTGLPAEALRKLLPKVIGQAEAGKRLAKLLTEEIDAAKPGFPS